MEGTFNLVVFPTGRPKRAVNGSMKERRMEE